MHFGEKEVGNQKDRLRLVMICPVSKDAGTL